MYRRDFYLFSHPAFTYDECIIDKFRVAEKVLAIKKPLVLPNSLHL